jgi:hypothetical protein
MKMKMPMVWEILSRFKDSCKSRGWRTSESEDWVEIKDDYHNFLWTKDVHPSSFKKIAANKKCIVREGLTYRVVEAAYTAWLFSNEPSEALNRIVLENPDFTNRIAIYDLSPLLEGKNLCGRLNCTESFVFQEFESFLKNELRVRLKPLSLATDPNTNSSNCTIAEVA